MSNESNDDNYAGDVYNHTHHHANHNAGVITAALVALLLGLSYLGSDAYNTYAEHANERAITTLKLQHVGEQEKFQRQMHLRAVEACEKAGGAVFSNGSQASCRPLATWKP